MKRNGLLSSLAFLITAVAAQPAGGGVWEGLKIGISTAQDAKTILGTPSSEYPDSLLFSGGAVKSVLRPDTIVVNLNGNKVVESLFIFPLWGVTEGDVRAAFGEGRRMTYGEFLGRSGIKAHGAGTRAAEKLHYLPLELPCEAYPDRNAFVVYEDRDLESGEQLVKLVVFYEGPGK